MTAEIRVLAAPKDENPYQQFLYDAVGSLGATVAYETGPTRSQTCNVLLAPAMLVRRRVEGFRILHIHWLFQFALPWARRAGWSRLAMQWWFRFYLWVAHAIGMRIVWTAHDLVPHEPVFSDNRVARDNLISRADAVIALVPAGAAALSALGAHDVTVIPFGSYAEPYPVTLGREEARKQIGVDPDDDVMLLIGKIEPYKGADLLLDAAARLDDSPARVVVAGACPDPDYARCLAELAARAGSRAVLRLERIPDDEMAWYLVAADFGVFPFRAVSNSSSILLAESFGLPVVIPDLESLADVPEQAAIRYAPGGDGLLAALRRACLLGHEDRQAMGKAAHERAHATEWESVARMHVDLYERLLGH